MLQIYIWGAGKNLPIVYESIDKTKCSILGIIDSDVTKQGNSWNEVIRIVSPQSIENNEFNYLIISPFETECIIKQCIGMNIKQEKIICFWNDDRHFDFIDRKCKEIFLLQKENKLLKAKLENMPYELNIEKTPNIVSAEMLLTKIVSDNSSLCRFGDGEFEIIRNRVRPWFQNPNDELSVRLKEVLSSQNAYINIAIANLYGSLKAYKEQEADSMRQYLYGGTRQAHMDLIDIDRVYYDAYVSRPFIIYKDPEHAKIVFSMWKQIFFERNILIVEGKYSRFGVGNNLLNGAKSVKRIICPPRNAFSVYNSILEVVLKVVRKDDLVLISLGPTATVLAYDIALKGIQAIDIGQLDNEYEWFIKGVSKRTPIKGKCVAELSGAYIPEEKMGLEKYKNECVCEIA